MIDLVEKLKLWLFTADIDTLTAAGWRLQQLESASRETVLSIIEYGISPAYAVYLVKPCGSSYVWIGNVATTITENDTIDLADNVIRTLWDKLPHGRDARLVLKGMQDVVDDMYNPVQPTTEDNRTFNVVLSADHPLWQELWESAHPVEALAEAHGRPAENQRTL